MALDRRSSLSPLSAQHSMTQSRLACLPVLLPHVVHTQETRPHAAATPHSDRRTSTTILTPMTAYRLHRCFLLRLRKMASGVMLHSQASPWHVSYEFKQVINQCRSTLRSWNSLTVTRSGLEMFETRRRNRKSKQATRTKLSEKVEANNL